MAGLHIVADQDIPFLRGILEPHARVTYLPGPAITRQALKDADALLVRTRTRCDQALLEDTPVAFIGSATIGYDHIDTLWCDEQQITWVNAPGCNSSSVMQYMASALAFLCRRFTAPPSSFTLGIIGVGNVGSKVEKMARSLGMKVLLNDPPRERREGTAGFVSLETIAREADMVSLHVPLTHTGDDPTVHLCDEDFLDNLRHKPVLINTSRGEVADTNALTRALHQGKIRSAVIDVWEGEPIIDRDLLGLADIATPHIAGYSLQGKANGTAMVVQALSRFFRLPLDQWYPDTLPPPRKELIDMTGTKDETELVLSAIEATYRVEEDSRLLKHSPGGFERQRSHYPPRHEFPSYRVKTAGHPFPPRETLANLGFGLA